MKRRSGLWSFLFFFCVLVSPSLAREGASVQLDALHVLAGREERAETDFSRPVRVLYREDLERIPGARLEDLLSREAGITPRGGAGKSGGLDIRGMGDTFSSNVLVLLDDIPLNAKDLSAVDFSAIALSDVERIEIHRGAGSVTWGDGAVGGVVRIFTRRDEKPAASLRTETGSFGYQKNRFQISAGEGRVGLRFRAGQEKTDGFRENSDFFSKDAGLDIFSHQKSPVDFRLSGQVHSDAWGLAGPVSEGEDVRSASTPLDRGESLEKRVSGQAGMDLGGWGKVRMQRSLRYSNQTLDMTGRTAALASGSFPVQIRATEKTARLDYDFPFLGRELLRRIHLGLDHQESHYTRTDPDPNLAQRHNGRIRALGGFFLADLALGEKLSLSLGARRQRVRGEYRLDRLRNQGWRQHQAQDKSWDMEAWDLGLTHEVWPWLTLYTSFAASFRSPNVDEMAQSASDLSPQKGRHWELGLRSFVPGTLRLDLGFFSMTVEDEIHYDTLLQENRNYGEETERRGLEASLSLYPLPSWTFRLDVTWMEARFAGRDTVIPLTPELHGGVQLAWEPVEAFGLYLGGRWYGKRYDGNDTENREKTLDPYSLWDLRFCLRQRPLDVFVEMNNLLDTAYALAAYSGADYPMPGRHLRAGLTFSF